MQKNFEILQKMIQDTNGSEYDRKQNPAMHVFAKFFVFTETYSTYIGFEFLTLNLGGSMNNDT